jgi:hypothetical protein
VILQPGVYFTTRSIQLGQATPGLVTGRGGRPDKELTRGYSNLWISGSNTTDPEATYIVPTAALNGSQDVLYNNVFNANMFYTYSWPGRCGPLPRSQYPKNLRFSNFSIDAINQSNDGSPDCTTPPTWGFSLAAIEFQNVDNARVSDMVIRHAWGNGIVVGSLDPRLGASRVDTDCDGIQDTLWGDPALLDGIVTNVRFYNNVRGKLPNYSCNGVEFTGSVVQFGAIRNTGPSTVRVSNNTFVSSGGPAIDAFNARGIIIDKNHFEGTQGDWAPQMSKNSIIRTSG